MAFIRYYQQHYSGGFNPRTMFTRQADTTAEMEVPKTTTPYAAM